MIRERYTLRKRALLVVVLVIASIVFSACSIDLSRLLEEGNNDYDFLNNGVDDVLDTGPVKNGVLKFVFHRARHSQSHIDFQCLCKGVFLLVFESLVRLDGIRRLCRFWPKAGKDPMMDWYGHFIKRKYLLARWYTFFSGRRGIYGKRYNECGGKQSVQDMF